MTRIKCKDGTQFMRVSTLCDEHDDFCTSVAKPTQRQIADLLVFNAAIRVDRRMQRRSLVGLVQAKEQVNLQRSSSMVYRAGEEVVSSIHGE